MGAFTGRTDSAQALHLAQPRCVRAKPVSGTGPSHFLLRFQSDCRSQRWTDMLTAKSPIFPQAVYYEKM